MGAVEAAAVDHRPVAGEGQLLVAVDHLADRKAEALGELEVALVVRRDGHDRAGAVLGQHVVGDEHRQLLAVDRVGDGPAQRHAGLLPVLFAALLGAGRQRALDVLADVRRVGHPQHVGVLGRHHEEGGPEQRVGAGGEHLVVGAQLLTAEGDLRALRAADPVALHRLDVRGPVDVVEVVEQPVGVVGDLEEPLLQRARLHEAAAPLAAPVDHLLVGQHGLVLGAPVHRGLAAVGQSLLEQAQEDPLRPAVVAGLVGAELAGPVDRDAPVLELAPELLDRGLGRLPRVLAGADRVVLGRQPERVVAQGMEHPEPVAAPEVGDGVAHRVDLQMADVGLARGVGQHLQDIGLRALVGLVGDLPGALLGP